MTPGWPDWPIDELGPRSVTILQLAGGVPAAVAIDNVTLGRAIGGVRIRPQITPAEVVRLARGMTLKIESRPVAMTAGDLLRLVLALDTTVSDLVGTEPPDHPERALGPVHPTLEGMSRPECLTMLQTTGIGRIAYEAADQLTVVPVTFRLHDGLIAFRTAQDSTIAQYALEPVAFEVDRIDEGMHEGWSVLVNGTVRPATDEEAAQVLQLVEPWAGGHRDTCMVIEPVQVSGRRLRAW